MNKTLLVMAAGLGSRYGSLKQIDTVGPHGQVLLDYSVYDARRSGFDKVVFVIRESFAASFKEKFNQNRFGTDLEIHYVNQELNTLTGNFKINPTRTKPWGTGHAVLVAKDVIHEPFLVSNADDFCGRETFEIASKYLDKIATKEKKYCTVGFELSGMLSENGAVSRGIFSAKADGNLASIEEHTQVQKIGDKIVGKNSQGKDVILPADALVSANILGFTPDYFDYTFTYWQEFLRGHSMDENTEFFLPTTVDNLIAREGATVKILPTTARWLGITYQEDKKSVVENIAKLTQAGVYPEKLW